MIPTSFVNLPRVTFCQRIPQQVVTASSRRWSCSRRPTTTVQEPRCSSARHFTQSTCRRWELGQGIVEDTVEKRQWKQDEKQGWKSLAVADMPVKDAYPLLTSAIIPRPIAFVSTISSSGIRNLAPMSYFSMISHNPPLVTVSLSLSPRRPKDTRENIKATKEFTVNIISEPFVEAANSCSVEAPDYVDEWVVSGLTPIPSVQVKPPRVKESAVNLECELYDLKDIAPPGTDIPTTTLAIGLIKQIHVRNAVLSSDQKTVDPYRLRPVARLGGNSYSRIDSTFELGRPSWKALKERIDEMMGTVGKK
ncbi:hypothetical protein BXZ70DRAFT_689343 [Cristinia sonorae]|uniref:Flavin reductase like domain-containing protein n=1 Tax=Cristinia sonorae TaxID=1940300 RepID=A0A8K0UEH7_9AGAR|nr:hypothetical protein BXZ70DRAFT_689343 [Cristinia sonorae]